MLSEEMRYVYFGHHKCASSYILNILRDIGRLLGLPTLAGFLTHTLPLGYHSDPYFAARIQRLRDEKLQVEHGIFAFRNADEEMRRHVAQSGSYRGFHVIRDPRDMLVSAYFSHLYSHPLPADGPWFGIQRQRLQHAEGIEAGLLSEMEFSATYFEHLTTWNYADPNILETNYETLTEQPFATFRQILGFWGISTPLLGAGEGVAFLASRRLRRVMRCVPPYHCQTLPQPALWYILARHHFMKNAQGRRPGEENRQHHYRKGIAGDWRHYFTPRVTDLFKAHYGALLIQLGYEADLNWP